jgi:very-short-patch-repair endonuclease
MPLEKDARRERPTTPVRPRAYNDKATPATSPTIFAHLDARDLLWCRMQGRQLGGFRFHRDLKIPPYKVDFVCLGRRLVVEVVPNKILDEQRQRSLGEVGYRLISFCEQAVLAQTETVLQTILKALAEQRRR